MLILTPHALVAALLGMLVELEQFEVAFAEPGERPEDALVRLRPVLVIVLDADAEAARSDLFFARAAKRGVRVVLFQAPGSGTSAESIARSRGLSWFSIPVDRATLARVIGDGTPRTRSGIDRRRPEVADPTPERTLIFNDALGRRWIVYDRRAAERRSGEGEPSGAGAAGDVRVFVSETGEEWRLPLDGGAVLATTTEALLEQLARATPVRSGDA